MLHTVLQAFFVFMIPASTGTIKLEMEGAVKDYTPLLLHKIQADLAMQAGCIASQVLLAPRYLCAVAGE